MAYDFGSGKIRVGPHAMPARLKDGTTHYPDGSIRVTDPDKWMKFNMSRFLLTSDNRAEECREL